MDFSNERDKKRPVFIGVIIAVLLVFIVLTVRLLTATVFKDIGRSDENTFSSTAEQELPPKELRIHDIYQGEKRIPYFDVPLNEYNNEAFLKASSSGKIFYDDALVGIDVSDYQKDIDWAKVKADGIDFAVIRVGYRGFTQGGIQADGRFVANITGALENDIEVGIYFFSQAITVQEAIEEANYAIEQAKDFELTYPIFYDWEPITNYAENVVPRTQGCTGEEITAFTRTFCETVKQAGYFPAFYTNKSMGYSMYDLEILQDYDMWYAEYQDVPSYYYHFDLWQYTDSAVIDGVPVEVDLNLSMKRYK